MKFKISILLIFFLFLIVLLPSAYPQMPGLKYNPGMVQKKEEPRCWRVSELQLSPEQLKALDLIQQNYNQETHLLRTQILVKWLELRELLTNPEIKMEYIRSKQGELFDLQHKLEEKLVEYLIKLRGLLSQEQIKHWCPEKEFPSRREMMRRHGPMDQMFLY